MRIDYMEVAYLSLIGTLMGLMFVSSRFGNRPSFQMKLVHCADTGVNIMARTTKFANSNPRIVLKNLQALQDKGYHIDSLNPDKKYKWTDIKYDWVTLGSIKTEKSLDEFCKDCKEGGLHAEFYAEYNTRAMHKEVTTQQTRYWHRNIKTELGPQLK